MKQHKLKSRIYLYGIIILVGTASWAFYNILNNGIEDLLLHCGITNVYAQGIILLSVILCVLVLLGSSVWKAVDSVIGR